MLFSIALMLLIGMGAGALCKKAGLPSLLGMILTGMLLGPYAFNLIDSSILDIS
ncbi:MAG: solute carrier family (sodium/hydrogen exchanger), er 1/2, partial [Clostridiales bacterium]|nr:solute carrier family (sodium/hydrogen exchanger), er 1/2 [Clostridiales bacterium]